jgi:hypothetical protein
MNTNNDLQIVNLFFLAKCSDNKIRPLLPNSKDNELVLLNAIRTFFETNKDKIIIKDIPVIIVPDPQK